MFVSMDGKIYNLESPLEFIGKLVKSNGDDW